MEYEIKRSAPGPYKPDWLCGVCGADFRTWMQLPGEDRRQFLRERPDWDITLLALEGRCPRCGGPMGEGADQGPEADQDSGSGGGQTAS